MLPETLTDHDQIHMQVLNEYKNSKLLEKYTFASEFIAEVIEAAQLKDDVPNNYRKCLIDIEETKDKLSLEYTVYYTNYIVFFLCCHNLRKKTLYKIYKIYYILCAGNYLFQIIQYNTQIIYYFFYIRTIHFKSHDYFFGQLEKNLYYIYLDCRLIDNPKLAALREEPLLLNAECAYVLVDPRYSKKSKGRMEVDDTDDYVVLNRKKKKVRLMMMSYGQIQWKQKTNEENMKDPGQDLLRYATIYNIFVDYT